MQSHFTKSQETRSQTVVTIADRNASQQTIYSDWC